MRFTSTPQWIVRQLLPNMKNLLLNTLATLTQHPRYRPVLEWSSESWTHNVFRVFELVFGKRYGAQLSAISSTMVDEERNVESWHAFYTMEAALVHYESQLRQKVKKLLKDWEFEFVPVRVLIPAFNGYAPMPIPQGYLFAVGFNTHTVASVTSTSVSVATSSHTAAGSDRYGNSLSMYVNGSNVPAVSITGTTWNAVGMTDLSYDFSATMNGGLRVRFKMFSYIAPAASAQNVTVSLSGNIESNSRLSLLVTSWTGVDQTTPVANGSVVNDTGNPKDNTATATRSGSAVYGICLWNSFNCSYSGSGTLISGGTISYSAYSASAAYNLNVSGALAQTWNDSFGGGLTTAVYAVAIQPPVSGPANVKTYNTNPAANIKTIDTNPIGNVKSLNTNT